MEPSSKITPLRTEGAEHVSTPSVTVWDIAVRVFHWGLVTAVLVAWFTGGSGNRVHEIAGFVVSALVLFRITWGIGGTRHARFTDFVRGPWTVLKYLNDVARMRAPRHLGHNPAGGAMIVALLLLLVVVSVTGMMQLSTRFFGISWVEDVHHYAANILMAIVPLHILGVIVSSWLHQENLVRAMFTGKKPALAGDAPSHTSLQLERDHRIFERIRAGEGMLVLIALTAGAGYLGYVVTGGRVASVYIDEKVAVVEGAATPQTVASIQSLQERAFPKDKQDYVAGGPNAASRTWLISSGGRLYDNWIAALAATPPATRHPSWPAENTAVAIADTWRCKSCHGWDYLGSDGQYRTGANATGTPGLLRARGRDLKQLIAIIGTEKHGFTEAMLPADARYRLALFLREGQHTIRNYISETGNVRGNAAQGKAIYENTCAACHGFDGKARRLGVSSDPSYKGSGLFVGSKANTNPTEVLHKIRNGHPGAIMISLRGFPIEHAVNVLAYARSLPVL